MSVAAIATARDHSRWLPLRFALREMRGGLRGFYVFITTIALGSMAIAGVGSLSASLADGLARQGQVILGGDLSFTLIQREATPDERQFLDSAGKVSASAATMRAMARAADGKATLVEMKAVDSAYPLFGQTVLDPPGKLADALVQRDGIFGAAADPVLLTRLGIKQGARLTIGNATFEIRAALASEPDKLAGGIGFGPRLLVSEAALRATGLLQPGSLVRWHYRLRLPANDTSDAAAKAVAAQARSAISRSRLGYPQPQQCLAAARAQRRALHAISRHRRPDRALGRRCRRRQCGEKPSRPPARNHRHPEGARRLGPAHLRDLSHAGADAGGDRRRHRHGAGRDFCRS